MPNRGVSPSLPKAIMCEEMKAAPADVPATWSPSLFRRTSVSASGVPPMIVASRSWSPPVRNTPSARSRTSRFSDRRQSARRYTSSSFTERTLRSRKSRT